MHIDASTGLSGRWREVLDGIRDIKTSKIQITDRLSDLERDWLIGGLGSKRGVQAARYDRDDPHRLIVEYDGDVVDLGELFDFLLASGLHPDLAPIKL